MKYRLIIFLVLSGWISSVSQQTPLWTASKLGGVEWMRVTELGYVVVGSVGSLKCLHPDNGSLLWENKTMGTIREEMFSEVPGTQFLKIAYGVEDGDRALPMIALVDVTSGVSVFDSRRERVGVLGSYALARTKKLLVVGVEPGKFSAKLYMYDLLTGDNLWINEDLFKGNSSGKGGLMAKMASAVESVVNMQSLTSDPIEADEEHIYITHPSFVIKLKTSDGTTVWRSKIEESTHAKLMYTRNQPNVIYVATETESTAMTSTGNQPPAKVYASGYYAFNISNGQPVWKNPVRINNERINTLLPSEKGLIVLPGASGSNRPNANLLHYETGAGLWGAKGKGTKIEGTVVDYIFTDKGLLMAMGRESNLSNKDDQYSLNVLNLETGELRFTKPVRVKGQLTHVEQVPKGILYQTSNEVNILDINSGSNVLTSSIESGGPVKLNRALPFPWASVNGKLYVFATREGIVKELDKETGTVKSINTARLELGGKELPKSIDAWDDGIVLCSDQNVIKIGYDGLLKFNKYFTPPKETGLMRALALAEAAKGVIIGAALLAQGAVLVDVAASTQDGSVKTLASAGTAIMGEIALTSFAYAGKALDDFKRRYKATTATDNFLLVLSEVAPRDFRLLQVNKNTGEVMATVDLGKDRSPVYQVDLILNQVYHVSSNSQIACFKLQ